MGDARTCAKSGTGGLILRAADEKGGLGVFQEIIEFGLCVGGVERQIRRAGAQACQIKKERLGRLIGLDGNPAGGLDAQGRKRIRKPRGDFIHIAKAIACAAGGLDGGLFRLPPLTLKLRKEVG